MARAAGLKDEIKFGRRILQAKMPKTAVGQVATFGTLGIATGTANSVINNQYVQHQKRKQKQAFARGKYYGKSQK